MARIIPKKSLGQHWLYDVDYLDQIIEAAEINPGDDVLEIGPGTGSLTEMLLSSGARVKAVEIDSDLFAQLKKEAAQMSYDDQSRLELVNQHILKFNLDQMPRGYKVVANIPYYLTGKIIKFLLESKNPPQKIILLVQKEVAERLAAKPGQLSVLAISAQFYAAVKLAGIVPAEAFTPPPKIDSRIVILDQYENPSIKVDDTKTFFRLVKAGFGEKRKKLRSALSGGLQLPKSQVEAMLTKSGIDPDARAQELSLDDWRRLELAYRAFK